MKLELTLHSDRNKFDYFNYFNEMLIMLLKMNSDRSIFRSFDDIIDFFNSGKCHKKIHESQPDMYFKSFQFGNLLDRTTETIDEVLISNKFKSKSETYLHLSFYHLIVNSLQLQIPVFFDKTLIKTCIEEFIRIRIESITDYSNRNGLFSNLSNVDQQKILAVISQQNTTANQHLSIEIDNKFDSGSNVVKTILDPNVRSEFIKNIPSIVTPLKKRMSQYLGTKLEYDLTTMINNLRTVMLQYNPNKKTINGYILAMLGRTVSDYDEINLDSVPVLINRTIKETTSNKMFCSYSNIWCTKVAKEKGKNVLKFSKLVSFDSVMTIDTDGTIHEKLFHILLRYCKRFEYSDSTDESRFDSNPWLINICVEYNNEKDVDCPDLRYIIDMNSWTDVMDDLNLTFDENLNVSDGELKHVVKKLYKFIEESDEDNQTDTLLNMALCTLNPILITTVIIVISEMFDLDFTLLKILLVIMKLMQHVKPDSDLVSDETCLVCSNVCFCDDPKYKIFGEYEVRIDKNIIKQIVLTMINHTAFVLKINEEEFIKMIVTKMIEFIKSGINDYIDCIDCPNELRYIEKCYRVINLISMKNIQVSALIQSVLFVNNLCCSTEDNDNGLLDNETLINFVLKKRGLRVKKSDSNDYCSVQYLTKSNEYRSINSLSSIIIIDNYITRQISNSASLNLSLLFKDVHKNKQTVTAILNIIHDSYDLLESMNVLNDFWNECVFYTFDPTIYVSFLNKSRNADVLINELIKRLISLDTAIKMAPLDTSNIIKKCINALINSHFASKIDSINEVTLINNNKINTFLNRFD